MTCDLSFTKIFVNEGSLLFLFEVIVANDTTERILDAILEVLAFAYTAPISALIHFCDREPDRKDEAAVQIEAFSRHFIKAYGI